MNLDPVRTYLSSGRGDVRYGCNDDPSPSDRRAEPVVPTGGCTVTQEILDIALPMILTLAADPIASLVDTAFIGRLGGAGLGQDPLPHPD